jgi:hypothetical protein
VESRQGVVLQLGGLGVGLTTPQLKKYACYEMSQRTLDLDGIFWINDLSREGNTWKTKDCVV